MVVGTIVVVGVVLSCVVLRHHREAAFTARVRDARRTVEILTPLVSADGRFQDVRVTFMTGPGVFLIGTVASPEDFEALRKLVAQASVPFHASFSVSVDSKPPNPVKP